MPKKKTKSDRKTAGKSKLLATLGGNDFSAIKTAKKKVTKKVAKSVKIASPKKTAENAGSATETSAAISLPDFFIEATSGSKINLKELKGKVVVLYFYPKDKTPGCTLEGRDFSKLHKKFRNLNAEIFGVSRDTVKMHESFKSQECFSFELLSDSDERLCRHFDVIKPKNMYGKTVIGIERSTFVFNKDHVLVKSWRKVKVDGHANEVLKFIESL